MKYKDIISTMTREEKAALCSGKDFWHFQALRKFGLEAINVTDGPHGLRKQKTQKESGTDMLQGIPAVCFPTASATSCSWDPALIERMGAALGEECNAEGVSVLLGPGNNIKRNPLCGRNFEYFSEDPVLAGEMAAAWINGVQSQGVGASLKHFAANNQEARRMTVDSVVDERTLREIYLAGFERAVKKAQPWTVMNAYNRLNGTYCAENKWLLTDVLRDDWGFKGIVITDWGAENNIVDGLNAGQNIEMPSSDGLAAAKIVDGLIDGTLDETVLDARVDEILDILFKGQKTKAAVPYDRAAHHALAREVATASMVLLKNEDNILPLAKDKTVAVIGEMAKAPRYQGAGSSLINPTQLDNVFDELLKQDIGFLYAQGYNKKTDKTDMALIREAVDTAKRCENVLLFIGLTDEFESEGFDRSHLDIPQSHLNLLTAVSKANPNTIVVLAGGAPIRMQWLDNCKAVLHTFLPGQAGAGAAVDLLFGNANPSGKLSETYINRLEDTPSFNNFPGSPVTVEYREGLYVGYRYYDKVEKDVLFPFGYGLSYTTFEYSGMKVSKKNIKDTDTLKVTFKIKNTGDKAGAEVAQVYVADKESTVYRPVKELKGFTKVYLEPGEEKAVTIELDKRAFAFWNTEIGDWYVESGEFDILVGASSRDIRLNTTVKVTSSDTQAAIPNDKENLPAYFAGDIMNVPDEQFEKLLGRPIPNAKRDPNQPIDINSSLELAEGTPAGKVINGMIRTVIKTIAGGASNEGMMLAMATQIPIRCFVSMSMGVFSEDMAQALIDILNGKSALIGVGKIVAGLAKTVGKIGTLISSI
ncbi:MAG: glycoside hydrolase family 3 C-terminal domain-containing protein [Clostridia bacterium]|nr:glycoside hydrolase family 3 C-terminal domain-containing protein [Clostridia bacterium]